MNNDRIILFSNIWRDIGYETAGKVGRILREHGRRVIFCPVCVEPPSDSPVPPPPLGLKSSILEDVIDYAEMIITFGGDGTILRAARVSAEKNVPILGINMGGKGFMAELEQDELGKISSIAAGKYKIEQRMMLDVELIRENKAIHDDFALNDVHIRGAGKVIGLTLSCDNQVIFQYTGDGVVIATPTGSTAYSLSAGGPIVEPTADNIIVTPICAHALETKPFVLMSNRNVSVEIGFSKHSPAQISVDGCKGIDIQIGDTVNVKKSTKHTSLVRLTSRSFYHNISEKLGGRV